MNKRITKRFLAVALAMGMMTGSLVGCGNNNTTEDVKTSESVTTSEVVSNETEVAVGFEFDSKLNEVGVEPIAKETITLTLGVAQNSNIENYDTNHLTLMLEEMGNVNLEFVEYPSSEMEEKIRLMMAGGGDDLPDIIIRNNMSDALVDELAENEMIIPLEDYYENCANYIKTAYADVLKEDGVDIIASITKADGHIYTVPQYNGTPSNPSYGRIWVYGPWLEAVGLTVEDIKTTDDFYNMLNAFKTQDPNGNGKKDEIPTISLSLDNESGVTGAALFDALMSTFVYTTRTTNYLYAEDGQITASYEQDEWKDGIKYIKSLYEAGLLDETSFTTNEDTFKTLMNSEGDQLVGCFCYLSPSFIQKTHSSYGQWVLLNPLTGPEGVNTIPYVPVIPSNSAFITSNCENPELAFRVLDLIAKEEVTITARWGAEGENWDYIENLPAEYAGLDYSGTTFCGYSAYFLQYVNNWNVLQNTHWKGMCPTVRSNRVTCANLAASLVTASEGDYNLELGAKLANYEAAKPTEVFSKLVYSSDDLTEATELGNELKNYVHEKMAAWITGVADVDAEWTSYLKELDSIGLNRYKELSQEAYDDMK